jgi:hypothetical protein
LTFWYAGVLALSLIVFAFLVYFAASRIFYERQDESLRSTVPNRRQRLHGGIRGRAFRNESESGRASGELVFPNRSVAVTDPAGNVVAWSSNLSGRAFTIPSQTQIDARAHGLSFAIVNDLRVP